MNEPITIPRTHIILDAAVLTAISTGPTPGSPFEASFGIRETMLPGWIIKTRGWNNADVEGGRLHEGRRHCRAFPQPIAERRVFLVPAKHDGERILPKTAAFLTVYRLIFPR